MYSAGLPRRDTGSITYVYKIVTAANSYVIAYITFCLNTKYFIIITSYYVFIWNFISILFILIGYTI